MKLLNVVDLEKVNGYCSIEFYQGDITNIGFPVDLLIVSAHKASLNPLQGTVIGALHQNLSIDLRILVDNEILDFRESLNCWVTNKLSNDKYDRIMVVEMRKNKSLNIPINVVLRNLFITLSILDQMGIEIKTIAMPAIGTGNQQLNFKDTVSALHLQLKEYLNRRSSISRILFIEQNPEKSKGFSQSLDQLLNRTKIVLPVNDVINGVKNEILKALQKEASFEFKNSQTYIFIRETLSNDKARSVEYGIACRRLVEKLLNEMFFTERTDLESSLFQKINKLNDVNIARWIISYLHVIRIFGNESAHELGSDKQLPKSIDPKDLSLLLFCVQRVVEFWSVYMDSRIPKPNLDKLK